MKGIFKRFKNLKYTFAQRLAIVLLLAIFLPTTYIIYMYSAGMIKSAKDDIVMHYTQQNNYAADNLTDYIIDTDGKIEFLNKYQFLNEMLKTNEPMRIMSKVENNETLNDIFSIMFGSNNQTQLVIYHNNPQLYIPLYFQPVENLKQYNDYKNITSLGKGDNYYRIGDTEDGYRFYLYRKYGTLENIEAYFEISVPYSVLRKLIIGDENEKADFYITLPSGDTYLLNDVEPVKVNQAIKNNNYVIEQNACGIKITTTFNKGEYRGKQFLLFLTAAVVVIILGILLMFVVRIMVFLLTRQLNQVVTMIINNTDGDVKTDTAYNNEFDIISNKLSQYSQTLKQRNTEDLVKQKKIMQMEFMLLQERISPHFLYNTLSSIKWAYNNPELSKLIDSMVKYYRIVLNRGSNYITLANELAGVEEYLKIQKFAYEKEFTFNIQCSETVKDKEILKNVIQPIAENAFMHGINCYDGDDGFINISALQKDGAIEISVENNGIIITDKAIEKIFDGEETTDTVTGGSGYAIKNIIKRIKLCYGEKYGLKITNCTTTVVTVTLPCDNGEDEENNGKNDYR